MLTKRIIPCLDVQNGKVVKGTQFTDLQEAGSPVAMAKYYESQGADEIVLLDITASIEERATFLDVVTQVAKQLSIPFAVGGGVRSLSDIRRLLNAGADKVSLNSAALINPQLIRDAALAFGSQCVILAIDAKKTNNGWEVYSHSGSLSTGKNALMWALEGEELGAGEILVTSIDRDGTKQGYDLELIQTLKRSLKIPIIASGGVGALEDIRDVFSQGNADAALAASIFHFRQCTITQLKDFLAKENILVRR
jgi:imidazole glycerol-phosphate synthase subunit HisF